MLRLTKSERPALPAVDDVPDKPPAEWTSIRDVAAWRAEEARLGRVDEDLRLAREEHADAVARLNACSEDRERRDLVADYLSGGDPAEMFDVTSAQDRELELRERVCFLDDARKRQNDRMEALRGELAHKVLVANRPRYAELMQRFADAWAALCVAKDEAEAFRQRLEVAGFDGVSGRLLAGADASYPSTPEPFWMSFVENDSGAWRWFNAAPAAYGIKEPKAVTAAREAKRRLAAEQAKREAERQGVAV